MQDPPLKRSVKTDLWLVAQLAWSVGYIVSVPAVAFGFGGAWLDKSLGTSPLFILIGMGCAMGLSGWGLWKRLKQILQ